MPWRRYDRFEYMVHGYLRAREDCWPWWDRTALWFRQPLKALYAISHTKACDEAREVLFDRNPMTGTLFYRIKQSLAWESDMGKVCGQKIADLEQEIARLQHAKETLEQQLRQEPWPKRITLSVGRGKEANIAKGEKIGLNATGLEMFAFALCDVHIQVDVAQDGNVTIVGIEGILL